eukprot:2061062-Amphidinium_carterae.1
MLIWRILNWPRAGRGRAVRCAMQGWICGARAWYRSRCCLIRFLATQASHKGHRMSSASVLEGPRHPLECSLRRAWASYLALQR